MSRTSARDCNVLISSFSTSCVCSPISLKQNREISSWSNCNVVQYYYDRHLKHSTDCQLAIDKGNLTEV